jgi:pantetheine-phosphate adenylyltransferase
MRKHDKHGDKSVAIYPGSFDPITNGHMDIIERATYLFDQVFVLVAVNPVKKSGLLEPQERVELIGQSLAPEVREHVKADYTRDLVATVDICSKVGARAMIRGLRSVTDFDSEFELAIANMELADHIETVFMVPKPVKKSGRSSNCGMPGRLRVLCLKLCMSTSKPKRNDCF